jgi:uncharacterized protein (TIGR03000 family)
MFVPGGLLLLAGAAVLATPTAGQAQKFGGAHFGGAHFGGTHFGGYHGGFYHPYHGYHGYSSYYPYYGSYGYYPYYSYYTYPYGTSGLTYDPGYYGATGGATWASPASNQSYYPPGDIKPANSVAQILVKVPADAQVWFNGKEYATTGTTREFASPPLTPGQQYAYQIKARWTENGQDVTQMQQVLFTAGDRVTVFFPIPAKDAELPVAKKLS